MITRIPFLEEVSKIIDDNCGRKCIIQVECGKVTFNSFIVIHISFKDVRYDHYKLSVVLFSTGFTYFICIRSKVSEDGSIP